MKGRDAYQRFLVAILVYLVMPAAGSVTKGSQAQAAIRIQQLFESSRPKLTPVGTVLEFFRVLELPKFPARGVAACQLKLGDNP